MRERHSGFDAVIRLSTHTIHLLAHDGDSIREQVVSPPGDVLARFGDPTPVLIDPAGRTPAKIVGDALAEAVKGSLRGRRVLVLTPDAWGPHRHDVILALLSELGARPSTHSETGFILGHRAAAPVGDDQALWVRVGSELTTAALVHHDHDCWVQTHRVEFSWGGDDIDDQLVRFVSGRLPDSTPAENLRLACREARESLSDQVTAAVDTSAGAVYLHRKDVEELAGPSAQAALASTLGQVLALSEQAFTHVLISGGTARTPLVAQLASEISGQPARLVDWRDCVNPLLLQPEIPSVDVAPERNETLPTTDRHDLKQRSIPQPRRRIPLLAAVAGGVAVLAFAVVGASQLGGATDLMRGVLGENRASVPGGGPPEAYAATQTAAPDSMGTGSISARIGAAAHGQAGRASAESMTTPEGPPSMPGVPSGTPSAAPANPASPPPAPSAPTQAPAPPAPAPAPSTSAPPAPAPPVPAPTADSPPPTSIAPPPTEEPAPADPPTPADPEPSSGTDTVDSATPETPAP